MIIILLLYLLRKPKEDLSISSNASKGGNPCPICGSPLKIGERVHSVVYPGTSGAPDKMMEIFGCPYCYQNKNSVDRICPVCKNIIKEKGYVIARMFERPGRKHVHVLGCTGCYKNPVRK